MTFTRLVIRFDSQGCALGNAPLKRIWRVVLRRVVARVESEVRHGTPKHGGHAGGDTAAVVWRDVAVDNYIAGIHTKSINSLTEADLGSDGVSSWHKENCRTSSAELRGTRDRRRVQFGINGSDRHGRVDYPDIGSENRGVHLSGGRDSGNKAVVT